MRIVMRILLSISIFIAVSQACLGLYFRAAAPTTPDHDRGAVYPVRIQGSLVYLTSTESYCYNDSMIDISFYCGAPIVLYLVLAQRKRFKRRQPGVPPQV
jgi:hypothetical protein